MAMSDKQVELEEELWKHLKRASETANSAGLNRIQEVIELLFEIMEYRAKDKYE